jgi:hypothetical protein
VDDQDQAKMNRSKKIHVPAQIQANKPPREKSKAQEETKATSKEDCRKVRESLEAFKDFSKNVAA